MRASYNDSASVSVTHCVGLGKYSSLFEVISEGKGGGERSTQRTFVLPVERAVPAAPAERVGLCVSLTANTEISRINPLARDGFARKAQDTHPKDEVPMKFVKNQISNVNSNSLCRL